MWGSMKTDRVLEEIKSKVDVVDFISDYVQLKKSGQNWKGLCPFHSEKTPSFMVNPAKQIFHCFGCGAGGDVISFVSKYENLSFGESLRLLAKKAGVSLSEKRGTAGTQQGEEKIRTALSEAVVFYMKGLEESGVAKEYVKRRGITGESLSLFKLGYAPAGWSNLLRHMRNAGFSDQTLKDSGLAVQGEKGLYDMFRQRLIFPISSVAGNIIAFGGRALDDAKPKYINSPETPVFRKSETLFGLCLAKESIRREGSVIIVEGYMDTIICHQHGFRNAVAPLGTSLTSGHIQKLRTLANRTTFVFDGDAAGRAAAKRALALACQNNYPARVLVLPEGQDPDSYLRAHGAAAFGALLDDARTMIDFLLGLSAGEKRKAVREALELIAQLSDPLASEEMLIELADRTRMSESTIRAEFRKIRNRETADKKVPGLEAVGGSNKEYLLLLSSIIAFPEKTREVISRLDIDDIRDETMAGVFKKLALQEDTPDLSLILREASDSERRMLTRLSVDPGFDRDNVDSNIEGCLREIEIRKIREKLSLADKDGDLKRFVALRHEMTKFIEGTKDAG
jgi:DNA primase